MDQVLISSKDIRGLSLIIMMDEVLIIIDEWKGLLMDDG